MSMINLPSLLEAGGTEYHALPIQDIRENFSKIIKNVKQEDSDQNPFQDLC